MREVWPALVLLVVCALIVSAVAWFVAGAFGAGPGSQMVIAGQTPIAGLLILWGLAIWANGRNA